MIPQTLAIRSTDLRLFSDACKLGMGDTYGTAWIQAAWTPEKLVESIDYRELFAIVAAALTWGHQS